MSRLIPSLTAARIIRLSTRLNTRIVVAGATIIDVGGVNAAWRGGFQWKKSWRVVPVVEAIARRFEVWISVDTSKPEVIREVASGRSHYQ